MQAFTLLDLLVGLCCLAVIVTVGWTVLMSRDSRRCCRINCSNNMKQIGLAFKTWALDNQDLPPMQVSVTNGGTMELVNSGAAWIHFRVMSNELNTPKVLMCPQDRARRNTMATTFGAATHSGSVPFTSDVNVSYFVGVDAVDTNAMMLLAGDRNLTNRFRGRGRLVDFPTNQPAGWAGGLHSPQGNIGVADGSVQQLSATGLRLALIRTGVATNRLAIP